MRLALHTVGAGVRIALRLSRALGPARPEPTRTTSVVEPLHGSIEIIDDPDGLVRLIGVRGRTSCDILDRIAAAIDDASLTGSLVHIDFTTAEIPAERAIDCMEGVFEQAERAGIRLRVVGLDPDHPGLIRR